MVLITDNKEAHMEQYDVTSEIGTAMMKQTTPLNSQFHFTVANAVSIEQLKNWDIDDERELNEDYVTGFSIGKLYVVQAITNYLKANLPILADEQISIVLESESLDPEASIELPGWFCWDDGDGALYGKGEDKGDDGLYRVPPDDC